MTNEERLIANAKLEKQIEKNNQLYINTNMLVKVGDKISYLQDRESYVETRTGTILKIFVPDNLSKIHMILKDDGICEFKVEVFKLFDENDTTLRDAIEEDEYLDGWHYIKLLNKNK